MRLLCWTTIGVANAAARCWRAITRETGSTTSRRISIRSTSLIPNQAFSRRQIKEENRTPSEGYGSSYFGSHLKAGLKVRKCRWVSDHSHSSNRFFREIGDTELPDEVAIPKTFAVYSNNQKIGVLSPVALSVLVPTQGETAKIIAQKN